MNLIDQLETRIAKRDILQIFFNHLILIMFTDFMKHRLGQGDDVEKILQSVLRQWRSGMNNRANKIALDFINEVQGSEIGKALSKHGFDGETLRLQTKKQLDEAEKMVKEILDDVNKAVKES